MRTDYVDSEGNTVLVVHLWDGAPDECNMCGALGRHRHGVPWYCGPVMEGESEGGYKCVCRPCHDRWAAWNDSMQYHGA
jgi:hypothetical protein